MEVKKNMYICKKLKQNIMETNIEISKAQGVANTLTIEEIRDLFINSLDTKESSKLAYKRALSQYINYLANNNIALFDTNRQTILQYKDYLLTNKSTLTASFYLVSIRKFYAFLESNRIYPNVAKDIKTPKRVQKFRKLPLSQKQIKDLLLYCDTINLRDSAIINLILRTGLRTIEVVNANVGDIQEREGQKILLIKGKGHYEKDDFVILTDKTYRVINNYLATRKIKDKNEPLFVSNSNNNKGERLTTRTISQICKTAMRGIGLNDRSYTAHSLRHTCATAIIKGGGTLEQVQYTLRHKNITTSQIYINSIIDSERLANSGESIIENCF